MVDRTLKIDFAEGILRSLGYALMCAAIFRAVAAAGDVKAKTLLWVGIGVTALLAILDIATLSIIQVAFISAVRQHQSPDSLYSRFAVALGLGIPAIIFQIVFLVVLGKAGAPYKQHPSLYLVPKVIFPITIVSVLLVIINAIVSKVTFDVPELYDTWNNIVIAGIQAAVVGCILRIAYIWNPEESQTMQAREGSKTALMEG